MTCRQKPFHPSLPSSSSFSSLHYRFEYPSSGEEGIDSDEEDAGSDDALRGNDRAGIGFRPLHHQSPRCRQRQRSLWSTHRVSTHESAHCHNHNNGSGEESFLGGPFSNQFRSDTADREVDPRGNVRLPNNGYRLSSKSNALLSPSLSSSFSSFSSLSDEDGHVRHRLPLPQQQPEEQQQVFPRQQRYPPTYAPSRLFPSCRKRKTVSLSRGEGEGDDEFPPALSSLDEVMQHVIYACYRCGTIHGDAAPIVIDEVNNMFVNVQVRVFPPAISFNSP